MSAPQTNCAPECVRGRHVEGCPIPATLRHDAGAVARCSYCRRYTLDPAALSGGAETPRCDCGDSYGWSGSFEQPGPDAVWSHDYRVPAPPPGDGPMTCQEHGPTVTMGWTSGGPDACPLCSASRLAYEARVEAGEAMLALESAEHRLAAAQAEAGRLREAVRRHGRHDEKCSRFKPAYYVAGRPVGHGACTCGLAAAKEETT